MPLQITPEQVFYWGASILCLFALGCGLYFRFSVGEGFAWTLWIDRDLYRAVNLATEFQFTGAEMHQGGRTPGGFFYYLLWLITRFGESPTFVYRFMTGMEILSLFIFAYSIKIITDYWHALIAVGFYSICVMRDGVFDSLWNPSFIPLFASMIFYFSIRVLCFGKYQSLPWIALIAALGAQIHLSLLYPLIITIAFCFIYKKINEIRLYIYTIFCLIIPFLPFLYGELFSTSKNLVSFTAEFEAFSALVDNLPFYAKIWPNLSNILLALTSAQYGRFPEIVAFANEFFESGKFVFSEFRSIGAILKTYSLSFILFAYVAICFFCIKARGRFELASIKQENTRAMVYLTLFISIIPAFIQAMITDELRPRYLIWLAPYGAFLIAIAAGDILQIFKGRQGTFVCWAVTAITLTLFASMVDSRGQVLHVASIDSNRLKYADITEIFKVATEEFQMPRAGITHRMAGFSRYENGDWTRFWVNGGKYIETLPTRNTQTNTNDICLMALRTKPASNRPRDREDLKDVLTKYDVLDSEIKVIKRFDAERFSYFGIEPNNGNCPNTFSNGYIFTADESAFEEAWIGRDKSARVLPHWSDGNERRVVLNLHQRYRVLAGFVFYQNHNDVYTEFNSNQLRRYDPYGLSHLINPRLEFRSKKDRRVITSTFYHGKLGDGHSHIILPPQRSETVRLEKGSYEVVFIADDFVSWSRKNGPLKVELFNDYVVR